jgi:hypothetical protein
VKRESRCSPTENRFANGTPFLLRRNFTDNNARFVSGRILKRNVKITVHFDFHRNCAPRECEPIILDPGTL